jgi:serine/threonine protein kinase
MLKAVAHKGEDAKSLQLFGEFLDKCLTIDPKKRFTADEALAHPFMNILEERI